MNFIENEVILWINEYATFEFFQFVSSLLWAKVKEIPSIPLLFILHFCFNDKSEDIEGSGNPDLN